MNTLNYADIFRRDLIQFREKTRQFYQGEISIADYKGFSGGFGSYAQRGAQKGMLRLRLGGGRITASDLHFIYEAVSRHQIDLIHLTTCQSIQLHNLDAETICTLVEEAWDHGIMTRGGGGDYPRNVMMTPLSGVDPSETFDLVPYVQAAADYLLTFIDQVKLPRKLKVCFSSTPENYPHATYRDLGFVAKPGHTFDVYSGGGLGRAPMLGLIVGTNVPADQIMYYIRAMVDMFTAHGNYEMRGKARTRFMQETLGVEGYLQAFQEKLELAQKEYDLELTESDLLLTASAKTAPVSDWHHPRVIRQKQEGLYAVAAHPLGGNLSPEMISSLNQAVSRMQDVEIRLTPDQGYYIINCSQEEAQLFLKLTETEHAANLFETSVACVGNTLCQVGISDSQELLQRCLKEVRSENFADGVLPSIHISGCPSSCGTHQTAAVGFRGAVKQTPDGPVPAYGIFLGGCSLQGKEHIAAERGAIASVLIPSFLKELGNLVSASGLRFDEWLPGNREAFEVLAQSYIDR